jgi:hypothetical protein
MVREPARKIESFVRPMEDLDRFEPALRRFLLHCAERISYLAIDNCGHLHGGDKKPIDYNFVKHS